MCCHLDCLGRLETQELAAATGIDAHRHQRGTGGDLLGLALADIEVGIQVQIGVALGADLGRPAPIERTLDRCE